MKPRISACLLLLSMPLLLGPALAAETYLWQSAAPPLTLRLPAGLRHNPTCRPPAAYMSCLFEGFDRTLGIGLSVRAIDIRHPEATAKHSPDPAALKGWLRTAANPFVEAHRAPISYVRARRLAGRQAWYLTWHEGKGHSHTSVWFWVKKAGGRRWLVMVSCNPPNDANSAGHRACRRILQSLRVSD